MKQLFFIILSLILFVGTVSANNVETKYANVINANINKPMTLDNIKQALKDIDVKFVNEVYLRIIIESGNLKSKLTLRGNNLFGMRKAGSRETTALKKKIFGYASYKHWIYSIIDYKLWEQFSPPKAKESYKSYLKRRNWNTH